MVEKEEREVERNWQDMIGLLVNSETIPSLNSEDDKTKIEDTVESGSPFKVGEKANLCVSPSRWSYSNIINREQAKSNKKEEQVKEKIKSRKQM